MNTEVSPETENRALRWIALIEDTALVGLLSVLILLAGGQVLLRNFLDMGLAWGEQASRGLVLWVGLIGAITASRNNRHINMDVLSRWLPDRARAACGAVVSLFTSFVCAVVAYHAGRLVTMDYEAGVTAFQTVPAWTVELILPFSFSVIGLRYLLLSYIQLKRFCAREVRT